MMMNVFDITKEEKRGQMSLKELLKKLEPRIQYLISGVNLPGMQRKDLAQELRLQVVKEYKKYKEREIGWWFLRLKWFLHSKIASVNRSKEPLDNSLPLEMFENGMKNANGK